MSCEFLRSDAPARELPNDESVILLFNDEIYQSPRYNDDLFHGFT
jgi:hypothetical protein